MTRNILSNIFNIFVVWYRYCINRITMQFDLFKESHDKDRAVAQLLKLQLRSARYHKYLEHYAISTMDGSKNLRTAILKALGDLQTISEGICIGTSEISSLNPLKKARLDFKDYFSSKIPPREIESSILELKSRISMMKDHYRMTYGAFLELIERFEIGENTMEQISEMYIKALISISMLEKKVDQFREDDF